MTSIELEMVDQIVAILGGAVALLWVSPKNDSVDPQRQQPGVNIKHTGGVLEEYNAIRPHEALGGLTPYRYAAEAGP
ncbi:MAG: hypothetical protein R6X34_17845 [Chloroflexota bacterium]